MKTLQCTIASLLVGAIFAGTAMAQTMSSRVLQPSSIQQMAFQSDDAAGYAVADSAPAGAASALASPSNQPSVVAKVEEKPVAEAFRQPCETSCETQCGNRAEEGPYKLFHGPRLECNHLDIRGFFDVGWTGNPDYPLNRFNGPVGYNDRSNEVDLNQFYLIAERIAKVEGDCGVDFGYRTDLMYGTDRRFVQAAAGTGWDSNFNNGNRFYGLAVPQMYGDLAINKLLLRGGHFYAPCGFEVPNADGNFFYSHTYGFLYGMPTTLTGGYATYKVQDKLLVNAGLDTGWNEFESLNGKINAMFGVNWTSKDDKVNVTSECFIGNTQAAGVDSSRVNICTDINVKLGCKWRYVLENTVCHDTNTTNTTSQTFDNNFVPVTGMGPASWIGWTNYLLYDINDCWGFGIRYEYFEDLDGAVVSQVGPPGFLEPGAKWNDVTVGLNWKPNKNVTVRSEVRWDWAANTSAPGFKPFDDGQKNSQCLWGNDVVIKF